MWLALLLKPLCTFPTYLIMFLLIVFIISNVHNVALTHIYVLY